MALSSIFFIFGALPIFLIFYFSLKPKFRIYGILAFSIWFYYVNDPKQLKYMLAIILWNYVLSLIIAHGSPHFRKTFLVLGIISNTGILFFYKYLSFTYDIVNRVWGLNIQAEVHDSMIGLSFFTFTLISYLVDVYQKKVSVPENPVKFADYILMFPKLLMGPIVRYEEIADALNAPKIKANDLGIGAKRFMAGFCKKMIIADNLALLVKQINSVGDFSHATVASLWIGSIAYSLQLFFDFSGYSDMAIGMGRMLGFRFKENFNFPYCCNSFTDFWRRWHISLSQWFRDYVYIPLGGSRRSLWRNILNLLIVWILTGIWHGAGYTFIVWGLVYFVMLVIERYMVRPNQLNRIGKWIWRIVTLLIINFNWVLFSHAEIKEGIQYCLGMIGIYYKNAYFAPADSRSLREFGLYIVLGIIFSIPIEKMFVEKISKNRMASNATAIVLPIVYIAIWIWALSFSVLGFHNPFMYQKF